MDLNPLRNRVYGFLRKAYEMVDDPSTDKIISWGPNGTTFIVWRPFKCSRDLLTPLLGVTNFARFEAYGFTKISVARYQLEFECSDFVKGHPELLEKIYDRYIAKLRAYHEKRFKPFEDRLKNAKTREEWDLAAKEQKEFFENDSKERRESRLRIETSSPPPPQVQPNNGS